MTEITLETIAAQIETIKIQVSGLPLVAASLHELHDDIDKLTNAQIDIKARLALLEAALMCASR
jgi:hypothetical protein